MKSPIPNIRVPHTNFRGVPLDNSVKFIPGRTIPEINSIWQDNYGFIWKIASDVIWQSRLMWVTGLLLNAGKDFYIRFYSSGKSGHHATQTEHMLVEKIRDPAPPIKLGDTWITRAGTIVNIVGETKRAFDVAFECDPGQVYSVNKHGLRTFRKYANYDLISLKHSPIEEISPVASNHAKAFCCIQYHEKTDSCPIHKPENDPRNNKNLWGIPRDRTEELIEKVRLETLSNF